MSTSTEPSQADPTQETSPATPEGGGGSQTTVDLPGWTPPDTDPGPDR